MDGIVPKAQRQRADWIVIQSLLSEQLDQFRFTTSQKIEMDFWLFLSLKSNADFKAINMKRTIFILLPVLLASCGIAGDEPRVEIDPDDIVIETDQPLGVMEGKYRLVYKALTCPAGDGCIIPDSLSWSNEFEVSLANEWSRILANRFVDISTSFWKADDCAHCVDMHVRSSAA